MEGTSWRPTEVPCLKFEILGKVVLIHFACTDVIADQVSQQKYRLI